MGGGTLQPVSIAIRPYAEVVIPGRCVIAMNASGRVLAHGNRLLPGGARGELAVITPSGELAWRQASEGIIIAADLADNGRVAVLESTDSPTRRWLSRLRTLARDSGQRELDAPVAGVLMFDTGTGGALLWESDDALWLGGAVEDSETDLWVGLVDAVDGQVRSCATFPDGYAESSLRLRAGRSRSTCLINIDAGQHGAWAFVAECSSSNRAVRVRPLIASSRVTDQYVDAEGQLVLLEDRELVKRTLEGREVARAALDSHLDGEGGFPVAIFEGPSGRALVHATGGDGRLLLVDTSVLAVVDEVVLEGARRDEYRGMTAGRGRRFATCFSAGAFNDERTRVVLWMLPEC